MGTIRTTESDLLDLVSEEIACSCGMLLTDKNVQTIAARYEIDELQELHRTQNRIVRIRPEDFEDAVLNVRQAIGNLPDTKSGTLMAMDRLVSQSQRGVDVKGISDAYIAISESGKYASVDDAATEEIIAISGADRMHVYEFLLAVADIHERKLNFLYRRVKRSTWDGAVALDKLFQGEHVPNDPEVYLDQRFADYLATNGEYLEKMHWRNFERLVRQSK